MTKQETSLWKKAPIAAAIAVMVPIWSMSSLPAAADSETLVAFDPGAGALSEGVTVDSDGNVFASLSPLGKLVKIAKGSNTAEPFGEVAGLQEGDFGLLGLTVDSSNNVYGGVFSANDDARGVWKFDRMSGAAERIEGSSAITLPNSVAFDTDGTMYVTDSVAGAVWRVPANGGAEQWIVDPALAGDSSLGFPVPLGANGIAVQDGTVYVGVMEAHKVVAIAIKSDGSAGPISVFGDTGDNPIDGIAIDADGNVYVANPFATAIVRISEGGQVDTVADIDDGLDNPTSVAVAQGSDGGVTLYIANFSVALGTPLGAGPSIVAVTVD
jgi:hypothetical protein